MSAESGTVGWGARRVVVVLHSLWKLGVESRRVGGDTRPVIVSLITIVGRRRRP